MFNRKKFDQIWKKLDELEEYVNFNVESELENMQTTIDYLKRDVEYLEERIEELEGKVYQKTIVKSELETYKQNYQVISEKLFLGKPIIHILSGTSPGNGFTAVDADLEDVYFSQIFGNNTNL